MKIFILLLLVQSYSCINHKCTCFVKSHQHLSLSAKFCFFLVHSGRIENTTAADDQNMANNLNFNTSVIAKIENAGCNGLQRANYFGYAGLAKKNVVDSYPFLRIELTLVSMLLN